MGEEYTNGPDQIIPSEKFTTTQPQGSVKLKIPQSGKAVETTPPISVPTAFMRTVEKFGNLPALGFKSNGKWITYTYKEYLHKVRTCAKAFLHLGLEKCHTVCILGFNSSEWFISNMAAIFAGGFACGIYTTNSSEACFYVAESSRANIIVVEDEIQLEKILAVKSRLPHLKAVIQYTGEPKDPDVLSWKKLLELGENQPDDLLEKALKSIAVNQCCTLVYTSGTVGNPKAVMISHDNLTWNAQVAIERLDVREGAEIVISYLPLSHIAAQIVDIHGLMMCGGAVYFADKNALKGTLVDTLKEIRPTKFIAVPRVWEKIYEKMMQIRAQNGPIKQAISSWARNQSLTHHLNKMRGNNNSSSWGYTIASILIFSKIKSALGLDRCNFCVTAAAPLAADVKKYFLSIDIPVMEVFGMSELTGPHTISTPSEFDLESIGKTVPGMKTKLANMEDGQGEICMYGRHVFMGYLNEETKTNETVDEEGWMHSGDLGRINDAGFVYITGRLKELIITAGGENVPPVPIEQAVKAELPHISNAFLVGDKKKFLSILLSFKTEVDSDGKSLDTLLPSVQSWLKQLGCPATTVSELLKAGPDTRVLNVLQEGIDKVNQIATSNAQKIQKFSILPTDFSVITGELGPTMKVKRNVVAKKYEDLIDKMYT